MPGDRLYHGTSLHCLLDILSGGVMRTDLGSDGLPDGVSMSTDADVARGFAVRAEDYAEYGEGYPTPDGGTCRGAVLAFSRDALSRVARLREVRWEDVATEREVRALDPFRVDLALEAVEVGDDALAWYGRLADEFGFDDGRRAVLAALADHPLRLRPPDAATGPAP